MHVVVSKTNSYLFDSSFFNWPLNKPNNPNMPSPVEMSYLSQPSNDQLLYNQNEWQINETRDD